MKTFHCVYNSATSHWSASNEGQHHAIFTEHAVVKVASEAIVFESLLIIEI